MHNMATQLTQTNAIHHLQYSLKCSDCGIEVKCKKISMVFEIANDLGWKYDFELDIILCKKCFEGRNK